MGKFENYRDEFSKFKYASYKIVETERSVDVEYEFEIVGLAKFCPSWSFPKPRDFSVKCDLTFEKLAFSLGMAEAVSYWKATCSPVVRVECGELNDDQVKWWKKLWFMGLGEFFYVNGINAEISDFVDIQPVGRFENSQTAVREELSGALVPIGGGKDSALTLETLTSAGVKCRCYAINKRNSIIETVRTAGLSDETLITAKRKFDRSLIELNSKGYLNGHTPFSAIVAFSAEITAYINRLNFIVLSNEDSANESTVIGKNVNHQYSKSFEFEQDFHTYEAKYLDTGIGYFSFLRPLAEFQIAKMFVSHKKYLPIFRSCNLGSKFNPDIWCGNCPKCLFVCLILSPFLSLDELTEIFGRDLLNSPDMENYFMELIGRSEHKPFECVGSIDEVNLAVSLAIQRILAENGELPLLFEKYLEQGLYDSESLAERNEKYCRGFSEKNLLPVEFKNILIKEMERLL